jgi:poly(3-hydroxybutyrate) depolymerase
MLRARALLTALALATAAASIAACGDDSAGDDAATSTGGAASNGGSGAEGTGASTSAGEGGSTSAAGGASSSGGGEGGSGGGPDLTASEGCLTGDGLPDGEATFTLDEVERRYILHLPNGYSKDKKWPVVLALHPNGGNIDYWNGTSGERNIRAQVENDAILVVVEDVTNNWPDDLETELAYFDKILIDVKNELCVDLGEIFTMGFSGGGSFSGVLGCRRDDIRAIVSGGAIIYFDEADCTNVPAAWITIGSGELIPAREEFRDFWRDRAGCMESTQPVDPDPCVAYDGCGDGTPVHYCQHGGGHVWPSFGTEAAWSFMKQFVNE